MTLMFSRLSPEADISSALTLFPFWDAPKIQARMNVLVVSSALSDPLLGLGLQQGKAAPLQTRSRTARSRNLTC